jgi:uncharacterized protein YjbI with pentapeptide repeats
MAHDQLIRQHDLAKLAPEIRAILTVLRRCTRFFGQGEDQPIDLAYTDLREAALWCTHLEQANLRAAHLEGAYLSGTHLEQADLQETHLEGADLGDTYLRAANLKGAHLQAAHLWNADLKGADLGNADLGAADFMRADLEGVRSLTVEQLCTVRTVYQTQLDPPLLAQIRQQCPELLETPSYNRPDPESSASRCN